MRQIKAIPTKYKGYYFRSRLEARWAVFFDALGVRWEYESEGYDLGDGLRYLPDFVLYPPDPRLCRMDEGQQKLWVEVKGVMTEKDREKIKRFHNDGEHPIIVVGNIDDNTDYCRHEKWEEDDMFYTFEYIDGDPYPFYIGVHENGLFFLSGGSRDDFQNFDCERTDKAFEAAKSARFEFGETPNTSAPSASILARLVATPAELRLEDQKREKMQKKAFVMLPKALALAPLVLEFFDYEKSLGVRLRTYDMAERFFVNKILAKYPARDVRHTKKQIYRFFKFLEREGIVRGRLFNSRPGMFVSLGAVGWVLSSARKNKSGQYSIKRVHEKLRNTVWIRRSQEWWRENLG